jgi:hypothetical protein
VVAHSNKDEGLEPIEVIEAGVEGFRADQLERYVGYVATIDLNHGPQLCGVIVAVSATSLIIERWDPALRATYGDFSKLDIDSVRRISLP